LASSQTAKTPGAGNSSAAKNFVREGPGNDVVLSPTVPSVYCLTVENLYKTPVKSYQVCFGEGHGLFGLILVAPLVGNPVRCKGLFSIKKTTIFCFWAST